MANLTNSAKLIEEMNKKAYKTELPTVNNSTISFTVNGSSGSTTMTTNQASNSTVNLTVDKSTVGLGNVDNTSDANKPISTATQAALDLKADKSDLSSVYKYKGSVASYSNLPSTGLTAGDVYNVEDTGMNYAWTGSAWDALGSTVDLSNYLAKDNTTAFTPTGDYNPATKKYVDDNAGTEYNAGGGISIGDISMNARKGPSPNGFHVPSTTEWQGLKTIMNGLYLTTGDNWRINLHMPSAGYRGYSDASPYNQGSKGHYWSSSPLSASHIAYYLSLNSSSVSANDISNRANAFSVRCFKDSYVTPDTTWTVVQGTLGSAGIFWNQSKGLISITDGTTGYTMMDKNLGATTVYNDGDTLTEANMGNMYQWGNNYGFPSTGTISNTSSTQVDASSYGPTNPYSSDTFITGDQDWSSVHNDDLWGDTTGGTITQENVISNTGVLSINGQTGDVTIEGGLPEGGTAGQKIEKTASGAEWVDGELVDLEDNYLAMRGPCDEGYHVPSEKDGEKLISICSELGFTASDISTNLRMCSYGYRFESNGTYNSTNPSGYWTASSSSNGKAKAISGMFSTTLSIYDTPKSRGYYIRPFKNEPVVPDSGWTTIYDGSSVATGAGVFQNATLGLISISSDGQEWLTIKDKNLGAIYVWTSGSPYYEYAGRYYQWGNNYSFPGVGEGIDPTTSSTQVDASSYGPGNYYSGSTFITSSSSGGWDSTENANLWGGENKIPYAGNTELVTAYDNTVKSGDDGTTYIIKVSNSAPVIGTSNDVITFVVE